MKNILSENEHLNFIDKLLEKCNLTETKLNRKSGYSTI